MVDYTKKQICLLVVTVLAFTCMSVTISFLNSFYSAEAESRGATASQYGLVFGITGLAMFLLGPVYGRYSSDIGVNLVCIMGMFTVGVSCVLFGFLDWIYYADRFIAMSAVIRFVQACGTCAFKTAIYSVIGKEFSQHVGVPFSLAKAGGGLGVLLGSAIGALLYELGGFPLPCYVVGALLLVATILAGVLLPGQTVDTVNRQESSQLMTSILLIPTMCLSYLLMLTAQLNMTFVHPTLEPHLRPLGLTSFEISLFFTMYAVSNMIFSPIWGYLCDKWIRSRVIWPLGSLIYAASFIFIGPAPFLPQSYPLQFCIVAMALNGVGMAACSVGAFASLNSDAIKNRLPDEQKTYSSISGLWMSISSLGRFIGPVSAGIFVDHIGFQWASQVIAIGNILFAFIVLKYVLCGKESTGSEEPLLSCDNLSEGNRNHFNDSQESSHGDLLEENPN